MDFDLKEAADNLKDTAKKIPPWGWIAIAVVGAFLLLSSRRPSYSEPGIVSAGKLSDATSGSIGGGDSQSMSAGSDGVMSQLAEDIAKLTGLNNQLADKLTSVGNKNEELSGTIKAVSDKNSELLKTVAELDSENDSLSAAFNRISNEFVSQQSNTAKILEQTETTFKSYNERLGYSEIAASIPNIYFDGKEDVGQYASIASTIKASSIREEDKASLIQKAAGLGNNGVSDGGPVLTAAQIKASPTLLKTSLEQANAVIANRKAAGLDTKVQESWIKKLSS